MNDESTLPRPFTPSWHAANNPDAAAIVMGTTGAVTTYAELDNRSARLARAFRSRGLRTGDTVAILMENQAAFLEAAWAAQRSGLHYTAINNHLRVSEVQYIVDDSGAAALVSSTAMRGVVTELDLSRVPVLVAVGELAGFEQYEQVLDGAAADHPVEEREGREMLYSSGTTGRPKGVQKPLPGTPFGDPDSAPVQIAQGIGLFGVNAESVYLSPAPLYHAAPLVYAMSTHRLGGTVVVMTSFDPTECLDLIERYHVTVAQFVPTMFVRMLRLPTEERERFDVSSLQTAIHAAAPCPIPIKRQMIEWWGPILFEYYSGTEDIGGTFIGSEEWLAHPGSVGRPMQECHIVGEDGADLAPGETGLVYFAGGREFEYHNDPEKSAAMRNSLGWRTLGDIGHLDEDGYLYLTDREAHMIISGGVNIYPQEAENFLIGHPAVADVAVIGVPDPEMGEAVKAVVQVVDGVTADQALTSELLAFSRTELASYKCPTSIDFVDQLPRDENGKLYKRTLRDSYWKGHDSHVI